MISKGLRNYENGLLLQRFWVLIPIPMSGDSQLPKTQTPGDPMPLAFPYTRIHINVPSYMHIIKKKAF